MSKEPPSKESPSKESPSSESPSSETPSEDALLAWLQDLDPTLEAWIGDDTALLPPSGPQVVTVDTQIEGVHYLEGLDPQTVARRLIAVNLSDLAAAGARPTYCFLSLTTPNSFDRRSFFQAFLEDSRRQGLQLAGGDLARSSKTVAGLTVMGEIPEGGRWVSRKSGEVGDHVWLGGTVGASALGRFLLQDAWVRWRDGEPKVQPGFNQDPLLRESACQAVQVHLSPVPQLELGHWLGQQDRAAAIDLSDGLGKDLSRLCRASGVGARIHVPALPLPRELDRLASLLQRPRTHIVLGGGEDYVLLFALPPESQPPAEFGCQRIGTLTQGSDITWDGIKYLGPADPFSDRSPAAHSLGWDHLRDR